MGDSVLGTMVNTMRADRLAVVDFLRQRGRAANGTLVVAHMQHVVAIVGEDHPSVDSHFDSAISPPPNLASASTHPRLVQYMLDRKWTPERVGNRLDHQQNAKCRRETSFGKLRRLPAEMEVWLLHIIDA